MKFNYNTLNVTLNPKSRSIEVLLNRPEHNHAINVEMLFELESLFAWLTSHLEVNAITLSSSTNEQNIFSCGFDQNELSIMSTDKVQKYMVRFQKIITGMLHLPQTIICDLRDGASGMAIELALGSDIRIASKSAKLQFNSLENGWVSCAGGTGILSHLVGHSFARQWTLSSKTIGQQEMTSSGLVLETYSEGENTMGQLLSRILKQAPVARIQTKGSFLEEVRPTIEQTWNFESAFSFAALKTSDWKKDKNDEFTAAREFGSHVKSNHSAPSPTPDLQA
jgi:enoyl-CoA hydratase/carnithine racemase